MQPEHYESAAADLGIKKRLTPQRLFTPSPLITPNITTRSTHKNCILGMNNLLDFDRELVPTASTDSIIQMKVENISPMETNLIKERIGEEN